MLNLEFHENTSSTIINLARANAVFIYGKLVAGGMDPQLAKLAVERMWCSASDEGYAFGRDNSCRL